METLVIVVHLSVAVLLIALVLLQDSKSGSLGGAFGGGSQSVFGPMGAATLAQKATRWVAVIFAFTCIALTYMASHKTKSIVDSMPIPAAATTPAPETDMNAQAPASSSTTPTTVLPTK